MNDKKLTICFFGEAKKEDVFTTRWARYFSDKGHNVYLLSYSKSNGNNLGDIKLIRIVKKIPIVAWPLNTLLNLPFTISNVKKILKEIKPDVIHAHCVTSYGTLASLIGFHPFVLTAWGSDILITAHKNLLTNIGTKNALKKADFITCDAEHMKEAMKDLGADPNKIEIIYFGVDTKKFSPGPKNINLIESWGFNEDDKIIISLRSLEPIYNIETLIKAASISLKEDPNLKFVIVGKGSEEEKLKSMADDLGISKSIRFIGWVNNLELPEYLRSSDIYVSTSLSDGGIASSTAEAMACGLPVVITDFGDNKKWVEDGKGGYLIPLKSPEILAQKIIYLSESESLRKEFGEINRKTIDERNNYYREMEKMEKAYYSLSENNKEYKICKRCIMDTSDPDIKFNENGICNYCKEYESLEKYLYAKEDLEEKINEIKKSGEGKEYDCLIGLSGGVDSSMVAYWVKKLGLRPLAFHLDNGWDSELAVNNIEKLVKKLGIDFYTHVINWEEFKDLQKSFLKASVANIEIPTDHAIVAVMYKLAVKNNIGYIIYGGNINSEFIMPPAWGYDAKDLKHIKAIHKKFGKIKFDTFPTLNIWQIAYYSLIKKIKRLPLLNYVDYDKEKAKEFLKEEFGWEDYGLKHGESLFTKFFQNYILPEKFNIDKRRAHFSSLINAGQMDREDALEKMKIKPYSDLRVMEEDKEYVLKKLGLTAEEFKKIMNNPVKKYSDYPNDALLIQKFVFIYIWIKRLLVKL